MLAEWRCHGSIAWLLLLSLFLPCIISIFGWSCTYCLCSLVHFLYVSSWILKLLSEIINPAISSSSTVDTWSEINLHSVIKRASYCGLIPWLRLGQNSPLCWKFHLIISRRLIRCFDQLFSAKWRRIKRWVDLKLALSTLRTLAWCNVYRRIQIGFGGYRLNLTLTDWILRLKK